MALFYYQALERNGRKTKGMIEADSARHARQLLRGKELIPVHIEARMNASAGECCSVGGTHIVAWRRQIWRCSRANWQRWCRQQCRWKPAYRRSVSKAKTACKSLGMALRSRIQEGYTLSDSLREHPRVFDSLFCSMVAAGENPDISTWCLIARRITPNSGSV